MIFTFWKCVDLSSNSILFLHGLHWLFSILGYKRDIFHKSNARPDLAKFYQFGNILQVFGQFLKAFISIWQKFMPSFVISYAFGWFSYAINRPILKNNLAIWSQWRLGRPHSTPSAPTPFRIPLWLPWRCAASCAPWRRATGSSFRERRQPGNTFRRWPWPSGINIIKLVLLCLGNRGDRL